MLERCVHERFMHDWHLEMWMFVDEPEQVLPAIEAASSWGADAIEIATLR